jgi:hypothetical protein
MERTGSYEKLVNLYQNIPVRCHNPDGRNHDVASNALGLYREICGSNLIPVIAYPYRGIRGLPPSVQEAPATVRPLGRHHLLLNPCQLD